MRRLNMLTKKLTLLLCLFLMSVNQMLIASGLPLNDLSQVDLPHGIIKQNGRAAPPLKLKDIDGEPYNIADAKGKWVFVHFWATWCGPCRKEIPTIQDIVNQFKNTNLEIAIINTAESEDAVFNFLGLLAPDITPLMDTDGLITEKWQPRGLPATYFVDPQGKIRYLALGGRPWNKAEYLEFLNQFKNKK